MATGDKNPFGGMLKWLDRVAAPNDFIEKPLPSGQLSQEPGVRIVGDTILFEWGGESTNPIHTSYNTGPDPNRIIVVHPNQYRQLISPGQYEIEYSIDEDLTQLCNTHLRPETLALIDRFRLEDESQDECLLRVLSILDLLSDQLEGFRTGGIPL